MLGGAQVRRIIKLKAAGQTVSGIVRQLDLSRNTVEKYLREPALPQPKSNSKRTSATPRRCTIGGHEAQPLRGWLGELEHSDVKELQAFAVGLDRDFDAVRAALETSYSNGQVEGQVNRLKTIKRGMYGRAGLDLLKARVLHQTRRPADSVTRS